MGQSYHFIENFTNNGSLGIYHRVFEEIAFNTMMEIDGVLDGSKIGSIFKSKPINVNIEKDGLYIKINATIKYGCNVPQICESIQEKVELAIRTMTEVNPRAIHVEVSDIIS